ncbi:diadenylate cyclase [Fusobacterium naviforme]|uniref:Diadenylate cyclase n=1 Tax=Moryella indoligenes TaxID=371674 RepID=A0AAE3VAA0_9FIRM|nr:diadenylate cyclase CdaA [Moryella indoligenes]KAB0577176.1 TIGR00159 family protein [Fusobacterium naviforme]MDQ0152641.1 diadenylate cyclase [Moryella indoligenes]PSL10134.1 diadenylate cyclase [Fusobacterium naviforme]STO27543.1 DNA integrity scanning protein DisA [Fusobacterium naviforme]
MQLMMEYLRAMLGMAPRITLTGVIEIALIAWMAYEFLNWIRDTKAWILLRGLIFIFAFVIFCVILHLDTILWILGRVATIAVTALIIVFQPELRKALEQLGSRNFLTSFNKMIADDADASQFSEHTINELVKASYELGRAKTGALMVIEQEISLGDIVRTGIDINGIVSSQLLINIFEHNTPLHDGAVIIRGNTIASATCYLPLSDNLSISKELGTRHRAAIGISETTDSVTIVVSEETGKVSVARNGRLTVIRDADTLRGILQGLTAEQEPQRRFGFSFLRGKGKNERKSGQ